MAQFVKVATKTEFEESEGRKLVEVGGLRIAIFNLGGSYYAIENTCPHRGGPLAEGKIEGDEVICPWHGSRFNVKTGAVLEPPARQGVRSFAVRVTGDDVEVEIEEDTHPHLAQSARIIRDYGHSTRERLQTAGPRLRAKRCSLT